MSIDKNAADFESIYDQAEHTEAVIPYDIGRAQTPARQLAAYGLLRGEVLDPGTGDGRHSIHYAAQGYSTTGIDISPTAIERAKRNAQRAGVQVDFQVANALELDGFEGRFDTVVDNSFYHLFNDDESIQVSYCTCLSSAPAMSTAFSGPESRPTTSNAGSTPAAGDWTTCAVRADVDSRIGRVDVG